MKVLLRVVCNFLDYLDADKFENIYSYYDMEPMKMKMTEIALFLSQIEIAPKHFLEKKETCIKQNYTEGAPKWIDGF